MPLWNYPGSCSGGLGSTAALIDDRLYTRDGSGNLVFAADGGELVGTFGSNIIAVGAAGMLYSVDDGVLSARKTGEATRSWSVGDGHLNSPPTLVGAHVVIGEGETLSVLDASDGTVASTYTLNAEILVGLSNTGPVTGMAAAENQLYVPAGNTLNAF
jgi:hypothetical protein